MNEDLKKYEPVTVDRAMLVMVYKALMNVPVLRVDASTMAPSCAACGALDDKNHSPDCWALPVGRAAVDVREAINR
jgi:hypothetical protein